MWRIIAVFAVLFIGWWALLWGLMPANWNRFTLAALLVIHLLPPLLAGLGWLAWRGHKAKRDQALQAAAEKQAEQERQAKRAAAREQHISDLAQRQQSVACRLILARAGAGRAPAQWLGSEPEFCNWQIMETASLPPGGPLDALSEETQSLLTQLYETAAGAAWLPLFILPLPGEAGQTQLNYIGELAGRAMQASSIDPTQSPAAAVRFLPGSGAIAERVQQVFLHEPHLPGLIVLALDAPASLTDPDEELDNAARQQRAWTGQPSAAVVALLFLRDSLSASSDPAKQSDPADPYQPYWEKDLNRPDGMWGNVPPSQQHTLSDLPILARLSQPVGQDVPSTSGSASISAPIQTVLDNALVNAALVDYPFSEEDRDPAKDKAASIGWLVHNSGDANVGGNRLAALATALSNHQTILNPIDQASNLIREWGDTGQSSPALTAALAVTHCARLSAPVVLSHFEPHYLSIGLACPANPA